MSMTTNRIATTITTLDRELSSDLRAAIIYYLTNDSTEASNFDRRTRLLELMSAISRLLGPDYAAPLETAARFMPSHTRYVERGRRSGDCVDAPASTRAHSYEPDPRD